MYENLKVSPLERAPIINFEITEEQQNSKTLLIDQSSEQNQIDSMKQTMMQPERTPPNNQMYHMNPQ